MFFKNKLHVIKLSSAGTLLFLSALLVSATILPVFPVYAFETASTGVVDSLFAKLATQFHARPIHQDMTESALSFMFSAVRNNINNGHETADFVVSNQLNPANHFDGCNFDGATYQINELYDKILSKITPSNKDDITRQLEASVAFGWILHAPKTFTLIVTGLSDKTLAIFQKTR